MYVFVYEKDNALLLRAFHSFIFSSCVCVCVLEGVGQGEIDRES